VPYLSAQSWVAHNIYSSLFTTNGSTTRKKKNKENNSLTKSSIENKWQWPKRDRTVPDKSIYKEMIVWQNRFEWFMYLRSNFLARLSWIALGNSKQRYDWQHLTRSILPIWNSFIRNLFMTKSNGFKSVFLNGQASRPYSKIGIHLVNIRCKTTFSKAILPTLPKIALAAL